MKRNKKVFLCMSLVVGVLVWTTGCKRFLDREPLSATLSDYGSVLDGQAIGMYSVFNTWAGFNTLPCLDFVSIRDDDSQKGSSTTDGAEINTENETFQYTKDDWATNTYWSDHYYIINLNNEMLFIADSLKVTDQASLRNVGEALFFRAYSYFELAKAYGEVPLINYYYTNAKQGVKAKSPVPEIYALIDSDLNVASQYLPLNWEVAGTNLYPGRV